MKRAALLSALVMLTACQSSPEELPAGVTEIPMRPRGARLSYPTGEKPLKGQVSVEELLARAERNNARVVSQGWRVRQAVSQRNEVILRTLGPTLSGQAGVQTRSNTPRNQTIIAGQAVTFKTGVKTVRTLTATLTQPLVSVSGQIFRIPAASALVEASNLQRQRVKQDVRRAVVVTAFELLALEEQQRSVKALIKSLKEREQEAQNLVDAGSAIKNSVLQVKVTRVNQEQVSFEIDSAIDSTKSLLCALTGSPEELDFSIAWSRPVPSEARAPSPEEALSMAEQSRPDLGALQNQRRAADLTSKAEWSEYLPSLAFQAGYQYNSTRQLAEDDFFTAALVANVDLIDFSRHARIRAAKAEKRALRHDQLELWRQIRVQVRRACLSVSNELSRIRLTKVAESAARENLRVQRDRFRNGQITANDLLEAEVNLIEQEFGRIRARTQYYRSLAELDFVVGRDGFAFVVSQEG